MCFSVWYGVPLKRERTIAGEVSTPAEPMDEKLEEEAEYIGTRLRKALQQIKSAGFGSKQITFKPWIPSANTEIFV